MNPRFVPAARLARSVLRTQSDERLPALAASGSDPAFEALYRRPLVHHCARILGPSDAEEAVQDALVRGHRALTRGAAVRDVLAWLPVIAHNAALNVLRARAHRPESRPVPLDPSGCEDPRRDQRAELREVVAAVRSLSDRQREAIVIGELEGAATTRSPRAWAPFASCCTGPAPPCATASER